MDTKQKIIEASMKLFMENGYLGTSTIAIAEEAGVSEMTLFRKFQTKQNIFESMLKHTLVNELFGSTDTDMNLSLDEFTSQVLHNRLMLISKHLKLVQMIIQESLQGRLTEELDFIDKMALKLKQLFNDFFEYNNHKNIEMLHTLILGILLQYAIQGEEKPYHKLSKKAQHNALNSYLNVLNLKV